MQYQVTKNVQIQTKEKVYRKGAILTATLVGQKNIDRYLKRGYIALIGVSPDATTTQHTGALPFYLTAEEFLTPEQVNGLKSKKEALEYGTNIGVTGLEPGMKLTDMRVLISKFIEEATDDEEEDSDEDDEIGEGEEDNKGGGV